MSKDTAAEYCPGGTGKKIKHCRCRDISGEIQKVMRAMAGNQRVAALDQLNRLLATHANRPCLLSLKAVTLMDMQDLQKLEETVATFLQAAADNPLAHAYAAILEVNKHNCKAAVNELQAGLDHVTDFLPGELVDAMGAVAKALLEEGHYMAARGHLLFRAVTTREAEDAVRTLRSVTAVAQVPLLLKQDLLFELSVADVPWSDQFREAAVLASNGCWKSALAAFERLNEQHPGNAQVLVNIALARTYLGHPDSADAWHAFAALDGVDFDKAVNAEALALLLSDQAVVFGTAALVKRVYEIDDVDAVQEKLLSSDQAVLETRDTSDLGDQDGPPPKALFTLLDRPVLRDADAELSLDVLPRMVGNAVLYGRETDRTARIELLLLRSVTEAAAQRLLASIAGDLLSEDRVTEEVLNTVPRDLAEFGPNLYFPRETPLIPRQRWTEAATLAEYLERWPHTPLPVLDNKTPAEVAGDPQYRVRLAAVLVVLEQSCERRWLPLEVNQLRRRVEIPQAPPLDPTQTPINQVRPQAWHRLEVTKLSDDDLLLMFARTSAYDAHWARDLVSTELLRREHLSDKVSMASVAGSLGQAIHDSDRALALFARARALEERANKSPARWYMAELPLRLARADVVEAQNIIGLLQDRYRTEPGVMESLYRILVQFGILRPDGQVADIEQDAEAAEPQPPAAAEPKIWTPGSPQPPAQGQQAQQPSKLWVPGQD